MYAVYLDTNETVEVTRIVPQSDGSKNVKFWS